MVVTAPLDCSATLSRMAGGPFTSLLLMKSYVRAHVMCKPEPKRMTSHLQPLNKEYPPGGVPSGRVLANAPPGRRVYDPQ